MWQDKCAVFGIWNHPSSGFMTYLGLYAQQHRGQESAGIVCFDKNKKIISRGPGLVGEFFTKEKLNKLKGFSAAGHTRYSTTKGKEQQKDIQPLTAKVLKKSIALAHNGNIVNFPVLKKTLVKQGAKFQGSSDTEVLIHLLNKERSKDSLTARLKKVLPKLEGAYSFVLLTKDSLMGIRDPMGFRPLVLGKQRLKTGKISFVLASETCALDLIGAEFVREIKPGEIWQVDKRGEKSVFLKSLKPQSLNQCVFEHIYFARPDSIVFGSNVYETRKQMGRLLAQENPIKADVVFSVPDSGTASAMGFAEESGIPYEMGIIRNHYIGRTFIHPLQSIRDFKVKIKLSPQKHLIKNKKVVVVDDSLVRGTTSQAVVRLLKKTGAKEVHFLVSSPPIKGPCFYGVDTPSKKELMASYKNLKQIKAYLGADSLAFLSLESLLKAVSRKKNRRTSFCSACFTGKYPTKINYKVL